MSRMRSRRVRASRGLGLLSVVIFGALSLAGCAADPSVPAAVPSLESPTAQSSAAPTTEPTITQEPTAAPTVAVTEAAARLVDVVIATNAVVDDVVEVTAVVSGVAESNGKCTLMAASGGVEEFATGAVTAGNGVTYCGVMTIPISVLGGGEWSLRVDYTSPSVAGQSAIAVLEVN